jgi:hypothetical protein
MKTANQLYEELLVKEREIAAALNAEFPIGTAVVVKVDQDRGIEKRGKVVSSAMGHLMCVQIGTNTRMAFFRCVSHAK